jgi:hypothetical protein
MDNNIYRWAGMMLSHSGKLLEARHGVACDKLVSERLSTVVSDKLGPLSLLEVPS